MGGAVVYTRPAGEALPDRDALEARRHPLLLRAVGDARRRAGARAAQHDLGPRRDRRLRPDRQFLRRSRRAIPASPSSAPRARSRARSRTGSQRPRRQHARLRGRGAQAAGRAAFLIACRSRSARCVGGYRCPHLGLADFRRLQRLGLREYARRSTLKSFAIGFAIGGVIGALVAVAAARNIWMDSSVAVGIGRRPLLVLEDDAFWYVVLAVAVAIGLSGSSSNTGCWLAPTTTSSRGKMSSDLGGRARMICTWSGNEVHHDCSLVQLLQRAV